MSYVVVFIIAFFLSLFAYRQGIKDGQRFTKGEQIKEILPKRPVRDRVSKEEQESQERMMRGFANILEYGTNQ